MIEGRAGERCEVILVDPAPSPAGWAAEAHSSISWLHTT